MNKLRQGLTKKLELTTCLLLDDLYSKYDIESPPKMLYRAYFDRLRRDDTYGLEGHLGFNRWTRVDFLQRSCDVERSREVAIRRDEGGKRIASFRHGVPQDNRPSWGVARSAWALWKEVEGSKGVAVRSKAKYRPPIA